jgi:hypothetical protein
MSKPMLRGTGCEIMKCIELVQELQSLMKVFNIRLVLSKNWIIGKVSTSQLHSLRHRHLFITIALTEYKFLILMATVRIKPRTTLVVQ